MPTSACFSPTAGRFCVQLPQSLAGQGAALRPHHSIYDVSRGTVGIAVGRVQHRKGSRTCVDPLWWL